MLTVTVFGFIVIASLCSFLAFGADKRRAERGEWRVSESALLTLAMIGGWPGAKLGQRIWRHKTRKEPFRTVLNLTAVVPALAIVMAMLADAGIVARGGFPTVGQVAADFLATLAPKAESSSAPATDVLIRRAGKIDG